MTAQSLRYVAHLAALMAYRIGFTRGQLGQTHAVVADEVLFLAADELQDRAKQARKRGRLWLTALATELLVGFVLRAVWHVSVFLPSTHVGGITLVIYSWTTIWMTSAYAESRGLERAARYLRPPGASVVTIDDPSDEESK